jgi:ABC-type antimicrobial peptide transport system permease subunit
VGIAAASSEVLTNLLYATKATDPITFVGATALAFSVATVASLIPALRALAIDPAESLRAE